MSRIASADRSARISRGPEVAAYPSVKIRYRTCKTTVSRCSRSGPFGILNGTPLSATCTLARVIRRVMVASGTRKARAISAVVSPPTARRVSAICEAGDSAGWQHLRRQLAEQVLGLGAAHGQGSMSARDSATGRTST